ncbi:myosin-2 essential light chain-like [Oppia nitens]|uniref:myosin-2 essential light chain-like n=1 Tax=Oppia nitens TaxID=1686743 RepID=UPI0023DC195A|nr:myosin-2 essential light chain-like [Oppia nitens]
MSAISEDQIQEYKETFAIFDTKGDGMIGVSQLGDVARALGQNPTEAEIKRCCQEFTAEERISFDKFLPIFQSIVKNRVKYSSDEFVEGLRHFDNDGSGYISSAELRHLLTALGEKLTDDEVEQIMVGMEDEEGRVNYEYFVKQILHG